MKIFIMTMMRSSTRKQPIINITLPLIYTTLLYIINFYETFHKKTHHFIFHMHLTQRILNFEEPRLKFKIFGRSGRDEQVD